MSRIIISALLLLSMFVAGNPAYSMTYEQARKVQIEKALSTADGAKIKQAVAKYSKMYGMEPTLVHALILTESDYNKNAKSPCGAIGLTQVIPLVFNARKVGNNIWDIEQNIHAGVKHLRGMQDRYKGNIYLALGAYNIGGTGLDKAIQNTGKMPASVKHYVDRVMYNKTILDGLQL